MFEALVETPVERGVEQEGIVSFREGPPCRPHDTGVRSGFQAAEQLVHVLGVGQVLHVEAPESAHRRQPAEQRRRALAGHLAAQQGLDVADFKAPGPVEQELAVVAAQGAD